MLDKVDAVRFILGGKKAQQGIHVPKQWDGCGNPRNHLPSSPLPPGVAKRRRRGEENGQGRRRGCKLSYMRCSCCFWRVRVRNWIDTVGSDGISGSDPNRSIILDRMPSVIVTVTVLIRSIINGRQIIECRTCDECDRLPAAGPNIVNRRIKLTLAWWGL